VTYRDRQRLADIQAAIDAIRSHLQRGDLSDVLVSDAVRYFDVDHAILRATVDDDLPELESAVQALIAAVPADDEDDPSASTPAPA
jgi:uncharacterized protein with HEPN domain